MNKQPHRGQSGTTPSTLLQRKKKNWRNNNSNVRELRDHHIKCNAGSACPTVRRGGDVKRHVCLESLKPISERCGPVHFKEHQAYGVVR